jgi:hypothetical protein
MVCQAVKEFKLSGHWNHTYSTSKDDYQKKITDPLEVNLGEPVEDYAAYSGHHVAYRKFNNQWYKCDDANVIAIADEEAEKAVRCAYFNSVHKSQGFQLRLVKEVVRFRQAFQ